MHKGGGESKENFDWDTLFFLSKGRLREHNVYRLLSGLHGWERGHMYDYFIAFYQCKMNATIFSFPFKGIEMLRRHLCLHPRYKPAEHPLRNDEEVSFIIRTL